jgi:hypothetical protein
MSRYVDVIVPAEHMSSPMQYSKQTAEAVPAREQSAITVLEGSHVRFSSRFFHKTGRELKRTYTKLSTS